MAAGGGVAFCGFWFSASVGMAPVLMCRNSSMVGRDWWWLLSKMLRI